MSHVLVTVGDSIEASAMISMYLKELGVPLVWVKAVNSDHTFIPRADDYLQKEDVLVIIGEIARFAEISQ